MRPGCWRTRRRRKRWGSCGALIGRLLLPSGGRKPVGLWSSSLRGCIASPFRAAAWSSRCLRLTRSLGVPRPRLAPPWVANPCGGGNHTRFAQSSFTAHSDRSPWTSSIASPSAAPPAAIGGSAPRPASPLAPRRWSASPASTSKPSTPRPRLRSLDSHPEIRPSSPHAGKIGCSRVRQQPGLSLGPMSGSLERLGHSLPTSGPGGVGGSGLAARLGGLGDTPLGVVLTRLCSPAPPGCRRRSPPAPPLGPGSEAFRGVTEGPSAAHGIGQCVRAPHGV